jgi:hypothetical protein
MRPVFLAIALLLAPSAQAQTIGDLSWLRGCWRTEPTRDDPGASVVTEVWVAPPANAMFGYAYTVRGDEQRGWEQMRVEMIEGWPHFVALLPGQNPVRFRLHDAADVVQTGPPPDGYAVFANPDHDYPQRIVYRRDGNRLSATISRSDLSDPYTYAYRRVSCPARLRP